MPKVSIRPFGLIQESWLFLKKQPALWYVLLWLLILPSVVGTFLDLFWPESAAGTEDIALAAFVLAQFVLAFVGFWGFCSVLLVGRRMVGNRAGRSRTSFRTVRRESLWLIIPMFLTSLLRLFFTFYRSLLFFAAAGMFILLNTQCHVPLLAGISAVTRAFEVGNDAVVNRVLRNVIPACRWIILFLPLLLPAIIYSIRTMFYPVIVAAEGIRYREALRRSRDTVRGKTWRVFWTLLSLAALVFIIPLGLSIVLGIARITGGPAFAALLLHDTLYVIAGFIFTLSLVALYAKLRRGKNDGPIEVIPD